MCSFCQWPRRRFISAWELLPNAWTCYSFHSCLAEDVGPNRTSCGLVSCLCQFLSQMGTLQKSPNWAFLITRSFGKISTSNILYLNHTSKRRSTCDTNQSPQPSAPPPPVDIQLFATSRLGHPVKYIRSSVCQRSTFRHLETYHEAYKDSNKGATKTDIINKAPQFHHFKLGKSSARLGLLIEYTPWFSGCGGSRFL